MLLLTSTAALSCGTFNDLYNRSSEAVEEQFSKPRELVAENYNSFKPCYFAKPCRQRLQVLSPAKKCRWLEAGSGKAPAGLSVEVVHQEKCRDSKSTDGKCTYITINGTPKKIGFYEWKLTCFCCPTKRGGGNRAQGLFKIDILKTEGK